MAVKEFSGFGGCFDEHSIAQSSVSPEEYRMVVAWRAYRDALAALDAMFKAEGSVTDEQRCDLMQRIDSSWQIFMTVTTPDGLEHAELTYQAMQENEAMRDEVEAAERKAGRDPSP